MRSRPSLLKGVRSASCGAGPLLQRDYWGAIRECRLGPAQLIELVETRFEELAPESLALFRRSGPQTQRALAVGDEMEIRIPIAGTCRVRVIGRDRLSFTLATLEGHPEAGRITFGAYRNDRGDVVFHIRSRARASTSKFLVGYLSFGDPMQTNTWTEFVNRVALSSGRGIRGFVHAETSRAKDGGQGEELKPTFAARED